MNITSGSDAGDPLSLGMALDVALFSNRVRMAGSRPY